ncbi:MAG: ABC transporter permease subunit [Gallionella sp.]|jgi:multiple sugar transport system permease protein|nr:ABC transporter permease subunit [Gallionella sp.]
MKSISGPLFVLPALPLIALFVLIPFLGVLGLSMTNFDIYVLASSANLHFIGGANYAHLFHDHAAWQALETTLTVVLAGVPATLALSLICALMIESIAPRWRGLFRTAFFLPVVCSTVAVAISWRYLLNTRYGLVNHLLLAVHLPALNWLGSPTLAVIAITVVVVWKGFGYGMIILAAARREIPEELYDIARIEGAGVRRQLLSITVPILAPTLGLLALLDVAGYCQLFAEPYVLTQGGPMGSTMSLLLLMYDRGFRWWRWGIASALAMVLTIIMWLFAWLQRHTKTSWREG